MPLAAIPSNAVQSSWLHTYILRGNLYRNRIFQGRQLQAYPCIAPIPIRPSLHPGSQSVSYYKLPPRQALVQQCLICINPSLIQFIHICCFRIATEHLCLSETARQTMKQEQPHRQPDFLFLPQPCQDLLRCSLKQFHLNPCFPGNPQRIFRLIQEGLGIYTTTFPLFSCSNAAAAAFCVSAVCVSALVLSAIAADVSCWFVFPGFRMQLNSMQTAWRHTYHFSLHVSPPVGIRQYFLAEYLDFLYLYKLPISLQFVFQVSITQRFPFMSNCTSYTLPKNCWSMTV